jgi:hypothetical protein
MYMEKRIRLPGTPPNVYALNPERDSLNEGLYDRQALRGTIVRNSLCRESSLKLVQLFTRALRGMVEIIFRPLLLS